MQADRAPSGGLSEGRVEAAAVETRKFWLGKPSREPLTKAEARVAEMEAALNAARARANTWAEEIQRQHVRYESRIAEMEAALREAEKVVEAIREWRYGNGTTMNMVDALAAYDEARNHA